MNKYHQNNIQTYFINSNQEYMYMYDKYKLSSYVSSYSTDIFNRPVVRLSTKREVRETNLFYLYLYNRDKNKKDNSIQINVLYKYLFNMNNFKLTHDPIYKIEELFYQLDKNKVNLHKTIFEIKAASKLPRHQLYFYKKKLYTTLLFESVGFKNFSILQNSELFYNKDITNKY